MAQDRIIERNIMRTLNNIINSLSRKNDPLTSTITKELRETINILENTPKPPIPTRRYIDALSLLLRYIVKLKGIAEEYINGRLMVEDLYKAVKEYEDKVYLYSKVSSKERIKTHLSMLMPILIIGLSLFYAATLPTPLFDLVTINFVFIMLVTSIIVLRFNTLVANSLTALTAIVLLASIMEKGFDPTDLNMLFLITVYVIALAASLSYAHISHITTSSKYLRNLEKTLKQILEEKHVIKEEKTITDLENTIRNIYRKLYGEKGEDYLNYKLTVLMISQNLKKDEALKRLYNEVKEISVNREEK